MPVAGSVASPNALAVFPAREAVLGRKQRGHLDAGLRASGPRCAGPARSTPVWLVMRPMRLPAKRLEFLLDQHIQAGARGAVARHFAARAGAGERLVVAGQRDARRGDSHGRGGDGGHLRRAAA